MFRRILVEDWQRTLTLVSFAIFFVTFLATSIRTWRMSRAQVRHLENLPLDEDQGGARVPPPTQMQRGSAAASRSAAGRAPLLRPTRP